MSLECFERPVALRLPFRFGAATVRAAPQAFVRATIRASDGRVAQGMSAELMIPKWFDKSPQRTNAENIDALRAALALASDAYCEDASARSAFAHAAFHYRALLEQGTRRGLNPLTASYGAALADRAILDALCRMHRLSFADAVRANLPGIDASLTPDLARFDLDAYFSSLTTPASIGVRHTVGIVDPLTRGDIDRGSAPDDGLPVALEQVIARYGNRHFKLKLGGDVATDIARLIRIASVLDALPGYRVTLDGNEQFADVQAITALADALAARPELARLRDAILYLEQPLPRSIALAVDVRTIAGAIPLIIDESDATIDAFPQVRALGYAGVSSKSCKGAYKALLNAARCVCWNAGGMVRAFMTGEDLTAQPGLALQQDLALAGLLGLTHVERNGHHYANGFTGQHAGLREQQAFLAAHPDLYTASDGQVRVDIRNGQMSAASLGVHGYASAVLPDVESLQPMRAPQTAPAS